MKKFSKRPALSLSKGFTIIELIVVIAIIAVLAGIVLVNVTKYTNKSKDAAARASLESLVKDGTRYFEENGSYSNFFEAGIFASKTQPYLIAQGYAVEDIKSSQNGSRWCASIDLKSKNDSFCVDSDGNKYEDGSFRRCDFDAGLVCISTP